MKTRTIASIAAASAALAVVPAVTDAERRSHLTRINALVCATGRSVRDRDLSLIAEDVVGRPIEIDRRLQTSFRAELHKGTALDNVRPVGGLERSPWRAPR